MIERQAGGGAITVYDQETALARVQEGKTAGLFPQNVTTEQLGMLAKAAVAYGLDPLFGELTIYQGKPYISIEGRRRLDANAGHHPSIRFRPLNADEVEYYRSVDALAPRDVALICVGTDEYGATTEAIGILLASEREIHQTSGGRDNSATPQVKRPIEMTQKRAEMRWRKMQYGPHPLPAGMERIMGDDEPTVEGTSRVLDATPIAAPASGLGAPASDSKPKAKTQQTKRTPKAQDPDKFCSEHQKGWAPGEGGVLGHPLDGGGWHDKGSIPEESVDTPPEQTVPSEDGAPTTFPALQARLDAEQVAWDGFQLQYLGTSWDLYTKGGGTVSSAWSLYLEKTADVAQLASELEE